MRTHRRHGYLLIECLVYIALLTVVLAVTMPGFYQCWDNSKALRRNADDIIAALHAGEQWRADIRGATDPVLMTNSGGIAQILIPSGNGIIWYRFASGQVHRYTSATDADHLLLQNVRSSEMQPSAAGPVTAWTWELELKPAQKQIKVRPLFTFAAVAGPAKTP